MACAPETSPSKEGRLGMSGNIPYSKASVSSGVKSGFDKGDVKCVQGKNMVNPVINLLKIGAEKSNNQALDSMLCEPIRDNH